MKKSGAQKRVGFSIRWKLIVYFAIFVAIALLVMWVFQVYLLNNFYELVKRREMDRSAQTLAYHVEQEDLKMHAYNQALDGVMNVAVYRIAGEDVSQIVNVDATGHSGITMPSNQILRLCQKASENGGSFTGRFTLGGLEVDNREWPPLPANKNEAETQANNKNILLTHFQLVEGTNQSHYLIILTANLEPLSSTVQILKTQLSWVSAILLICAGFMVFYLYRYISSPLVKMNEAAKQLAHGKYDVDFSGEGYRETHELADTLNYASHELSRLDKLQKELIANISHDLRTPLTMIKGYSEVMRDIPGENTAENIQVVIDETTRLSALVSDLLDLSKIQSGTRKAMFEQFDLTAAVEEVMNRYDAFTAHQGYHITFAAEERATVFADRGMILQVLYNLINNAINYTGEDLSVTVRQSVREGRVRISVTDTGQGIEPDQIPQIWDRYYKVDKVHRRAMIGTGLGLSIVKGVLELHNAPFGVESQVGSGSTFWFELDLLEPAQDVRKTTEQLEE